jgi:hypothetical protein
MPRRLFDDRAGWLTQRKPVSITHALPVWGEITCRPHLVDQYPLCGLLFCQCGASFCRSKAPDGRREYMAVCGCRLQPIDADSIESRVYSAGQLTSHSPAADVNTEGNSHPAVGRCIRIHVGGTLDDIQFLPPS